MISVLTEKGKTERKGRRMSKHEYEGMEAYKKGKEAGVAEALAAVARWLDGILDAAKEDPDNDISKMAVVTVTRYMVRIIEEVAGELLDGGHHDE